jgi:hypothetical protein
VDPSPHRRILGAAITSQQALRTAVATPRQRPNATVAA